MYKSVGIKVNVVSVQTASLNRAGERGGAGWAGWVGGGGGGHLQVDTQQGRHGVKAQTQNEQQQLLDPRTIQAVACTCHLYASDL